jgi:hypothetical protein
MLCQACAAGRHFECGMQTWCECDCAGSYEEWGPSPDDNMPHADACTCETCIQDHPGRCVEFYDDLIDEEMNNED